MLRPLAVFLVLYVVFVEFLKVGSDIPHFPIYLLLGIVLWNFFSDITNGAIGSIVSQGDLIRKINFPKYVIVGSTSISAIINLSINMIIIFVFMLIFGASPTLSAIYLVPLSILIIYLFGLGLGLILATLYVRLRDVSYIWEVIMQAAFYATPILYPLTMVPLYAQKILLLNPVAIAIQEARESLITSQAITPSDLYNGAIGYLPLLTVPTVLIIGILYFRKKSPTFAEDI
jgi:ABC-2 type transport system permease protein